MPIQDNSQMKKTVTRVLIVVVVLALLIASGIKTQSSFSELIDGLPQIGVLITEMVPPDMHYLSEIWQPMADTLRMAIIGTTLGAILAIPFSILAAKNVIKSKILNFISRFVLSIIRTIPDLLFASLFVAIFGLGMLPGILAIAFFSFGLVAKLEYESMETIDDGPLEAMTAVGANKLQWIFFAVIPQALPQFISYVLYAFEINVRAASVLGLVGAGGIGLYLDKTLGLFQYTRTSTIILVTLVIVVAIDFISAKVRESLL
ncbi:phosphonate ABC transporter, permease protein PhnE [Clostridium sp. 19966]|uniref:phosphonate ABC transporter, permease protein PhnE n=1 Tax=Clostridium sp. 19966 TaxID=2768166 RepID=UPI0028DE2D8A|nr:phosphonate ABC transporter, permease protein PhnE [Clostridium sp. 19966]MDT8717200.1 phosphonate ABC transporter, permease protein PhnE [Clostridium sp. 19966]